jgi:hypothetical protein
MSEPRLDWATAEVADAKLTVRLEGDLPSGWDETFETVVKLLHRSSGDWDQIKLKKHAVRVTGVRAGDEEKLRHHLESIVQQANADHHVDEASRDGSAEEDDEASADHDRDDGPDAELTERFRSFADRASGGDERRQESGAR